MGSLNPLNPSAAASDIAAEPLYLHLSITDPEVVQALTEAGDSSER